jgi:outer membrane protein
MRVIKPLKMCIAAFVAMTAVSGLSAANLMQVYRQALVSDPTFKQAHWTYESARQAVPLNLAVLLPQLSLTSTLGLSDHFDKSLNAQNVSVANPGLSKLRTRARTSGFQLSLTQSLFNFSYWENLASASVSVKAAFATYSYAIQDLIQRTATAYFQVLNAREQLIYTKAEKRAFHEEYTQALASYKVGVKTLTDVANAKAAYDGAIADVVSAQTSLLDARENLRAITNVYYRQLSTLKRLPLLRPKPANINAWAKIALQHNWQINSAQFDLLAAHHNVRSAEGGHLPTLNLSGSYKNSFTRQYNRTGYDRNEDLGGEIDLTLPIFSGGAVTATVSQQEANYHETSAVLEATYRGVLNNTRQSYLGVVSGISKIRADFQSVLSHKQSLKGTKEGYQVGTQTMLDVLAAEQDLYNAQRQYAADRYAYIDDLILLKESAGTLSVADIVKVDAWLNPPSKTTHRKRHTAKHKK